MSDVSVSLGVTGKDAVLGAFSSVSNAGKQMGESFGSVVGKLAGLAAGFVTVSSTISAFHGAMEEGGRLADFSDQTGITVGKLVLLERAFENNGLAADDMGKVVNKMQKFLVEAGDSGSAASEKLHRIGLFSSELLKLSPDEQFQKIAKTIAEIQDPADRAATSMEIFGKSGGKLMALFKDMPAELDQAKSEVGNYADIMNKNAKLFDNLGDGITEIGHKLMEFAAGALSNVGDGLKEFVDIIKNFDAAGFGQKVTADIAKPIKAIADSLVDGNFKQALEVAYEMVKLQGMKMGNEFYRVFTSAVAGVTSFLQGVFNPDSYLLEYIKTAFSLVGNFITRALQNGLIGMLDGIPMFSKVVDSLKYKLETTNREISNQQNALSTGWDVAAGELKKVTENAIETTKSVYATAAGYFDIATQQEKVQSMSEKIVSDHETMVALTATIAANGKKFEESIVGADQSFASFKAKGGESGALSEMSGLKIPEKSFTATGLGPIDIPQPFDTKTDRGTSSTTSDRNYLADVMKNLLKPSDYVAANGNRRSWDAIQQTIGIRAEQQTAKDLSYYTGGDANASRQQAIDDLFRKYQDDMGGNRAENRKKAEDDFNALMNDKLQGVDANGNATGPGSSGGASGSAKPADPFSGISSDVKSILDFIKGALPQSALT